MTARFPIVRAEIAWGADPADSGTWSFTTVPTADLREVEGIVINFGRTDETSNITPSRCQFVLNNANGQYTPYNAVGSNYPNVVQNVPIRIWVNPGTGEVLRGTFFIQSWNPSWDVALNAPIVRVVAQGQLRRLGQGSAPVKSAIRRELTTHALQPVFYWPCEDATGSTSFAEVINNGPPLTWTDTAPTLASGGPSGSDRLPKLATDALYNGLYVLLTSYTSPSPNGWTVTFLFNMPQAPSGPSPIIDLRTTGTIQQWRWTLFPAAHTMDLEAFNAPGSRVLDDSSDFTVNSFVQPYGRDLFVQVSCVQSGTAIAYSYKITDVLTGGTQNYSGTIASSTIGNITQVSVPTYYDHSGMTFGHCAVFAASSISFNVSALLGNAGETAADRMTRLTTDDNVSFTINGTGSLTSLMGAQGVESFITLMQECETCDGGILNDATDGSIIYRTRNSRQNQTAALTLDMTQRQLAPPFAPTADDTFLRNDWVITRTGGSSARYFDQADIDIRGQYDSSASVNCYLDSDCINQAGWRVNLGTFNGLRLGQLTFSLARNRTLIPTWVAMDLGDMITISNPPSGFGADPIEVQLLGYTETIAVNRWDVVANCCPNEPYRVFQVQDATYGRLGSSTATLTSSISSSVTSLSITDANPWVTTASFSGDFPFNIMIDGEELTVTAITGSGPYTATVTRHVNGVTKAHTAGAVIDLYRPTVISL